MKYYPKIHAPFKRNMEIPGHPLIEGAWVSEEFEYLQDNEWHFTEKLDGMSCAICYTPEVAYGDVVVMASVSYHGKTINSQIPPGLQKHFEETFTVDRFERAGIKSVMTLYGEGLGKKINSGSRYSDSPLFVLFDVMVGPWWLKADDVFDVANKLGIPHAASYGTGTLTHGINMVRSGKLLSSFGDFEPEGLIARPVVPMFSRSGSRIITKIKARDFNV